MCRCRAAAWRTSGQLPTGSGSSTGARKDAHRLVSRGRRCRHRSQPIGACATRLGILPRSITRLRQNRCDSDASMQPKRSSDESIAWKGTSIGTARWEKTAWGWKGGQRGLMRLAPQRICENGIRPMPGSSSRTASAPHAGGPSSLRGSGPQGLCRRTGSRTPEIDSTGRRPQPYCCSSRSAPLS
jgi:hypothetical protein